MSKRIFEDHKKIGKTLQPPLLGLGTFVDTGWLEYSVPEFVWILLFIEVFGIEEGVKTCLEFAQITDYYITPKVAGGVGPMLISSYACLSEIEKREIKIELDKRKLIVKVQDIFKPFNSLYPESPMKFLTDEAKRGKIKTLDYIEWYKLSLLKIYSKMSFESTIVLASVVNFLLTFNRLKVTKNSNLPHLKEIVKYPNSDESIRLASFIRTTVPMYFAVGTYDRNNSWIKHFWNQNIKIEPCLI